MPLYVVIRKSTNAGFFPENTKNPSESELLDDLETYPQVYVLKSLDDAYQVAELFFHAPNLPKVGGSYGLIAEVAVEFEDFPVSSSVNAATVYNNWVDSQTLKYVKKENSGIDYECISVSPSQIKSIFQTFIPEKAIAYNPKLQSTDFRSQPSRCLVM